MSIFSTFNRNRWKNGHLWESKNSETFVTSHTCKATDDLEQTLKATEAIHQASRTGRMARMPWWACSVLSILVSGGWVELTVSEKWSGAKYFIPWSFSPSADRPLLLVSGFWLSEKVGQNSACNSLAKQCVHQVRVSFWRLPLGVHLNK